MEENKAETPKPEAPKRPRAKKLKAPVGPFATGEFVYDAGKDREIEVTIRQNHVAYRLKGQSQEYFLSHKIGVVKAMGIAAGVDTGPRTSVRIKRGEQHIG